MITWIFVTVLSLFSPDHWAVREVTGCTWEQAPTGCTVTIYVSEIEIVSD